MSWVRSRVRNLIAKWEQRATFDAEELATLVNWSLAGLATAAFMIFVTLSAALFSGILTFSQPPDAESVNLPPPPPEIGGGGDARGIILDSATCVVEIAGIEVDFFRNGRCEDGGQASVSAACTLGSDYPDCPSRHVAYAPISPPSPFNAAAPDAHVVRVTIDFLAPSADAASTKIVTFSSWNRLDVDDMNLPASLTRSLWEHIGIENAQISARLRWLDLYTYSVDFEIFSNDIDEIRNRIDQINDDTFGRQIVRMER